MISKMKWPALVGLFLVASAFAQQDPQDPGLQDSIICGDVTIFEDQLSFLMPMYLRADDSVAVYCFPLRCNAPGGGIFPSGGVEYFPPLDPWDDLTDTFFVDQGYLLMLGWLDLVGDPFPWFPDYERMHCWSVRFVIDSTAPSQIAFADTTNDFRNGSLMLGLNDGLSEITPGFQMGIINYGPVSADDYLSNLPASFSLSQNYPNPFNPDTKIDFALPSPQIVRLEIFDILGRKIKTLIDKRLDAGYHSIQWNGTADDDDQILSGIYFYRLSAGDHIESRKMILMK